MGASSRSWRINACAWTHSSNLLVFSSFGLFSFHSVFSSLLLSKVTLVYVHYSEKSQLLSHMQLVCDPMDCNPPGSSVHGILRAGVLERVAIPFSRGSSRPGVQPGFLTFPASAGGFSTI